MATQKFLVKNGLDGLTSAALVTKGNNHVTMLTGNASYPTLQASLPAITTACDALAAANEKVLFFGGKIAHTEKRLAEHLVRGLLRSLAEQVQVISAGDLAKIESAGFEVRKKPEPITSLDTPTGMAARTGAFTGQVSLDWDVVEGARFYQVWMTEGDPTLEEGWKLVANITRTRYSANQLKQGKFYSFRVNAVGAHAESPMSEHASAMAA